MKKIAIPLFLVIIIASCTTSYQSKVSNDYNIKTLPDSVLYHQPYDEVWWKINKWIEFWNINVLNIHKDKGVFTLVLNTQRPLWQKENLCAFNISLHLKKVEEENTEVFNKVYVDVYDTNGVEPLPSNRLLEYCLYRFLLNKSPYLIDSESIKDAVKSDIQTFDIIGKWKCKYSWHSTNLKVDEFDIEFKKDSICTLSYINYKDQEISYNGRWKMNGVVFSWRIEETEYKGIFDDKYMVGTMNKQNAYNGSFVAERVLQNNTSK